MAAVNQKDVEHVCVSEVPLDAGRGEFQHQNQIHRFVNPDSPDMNSTRKKLCLRKNICHSHLAQGGGCNHAKTRQMENATSLWPSAMRLEVVVRNGYPSIFQAKDVCVVPTYIITHLELKGRN